MTHRLPTRTAAALAAGAVLTLGLTIGIANTPAGATTPTSCCTIPGGETFRPRSTPPTVGIPTGETLRPSGPKTVPTSPAGTFTANSCE